MAKKMPTPPSGYSKWDKIDDSSDEEINTMFDSKNTQSFNSTGKIVIFKSNIPSVLLPMVIDTDFLCEQDRKGGSFFQKTKISSSYSIFQHGVKSPVSIMIGIPLLIYRYKRYLHTCGNNGTGFDNQRITYLMIDSQSGFADLPWQQDIGTALVVREDKQPFDVDHAELIFQYFKHLLSNYDFFPGSEVYSLINRNGFARFFAKWCLSSERSTICLNDFYVKKPTITEESHNIDTVDAFLFPVDEDSPRLISVVCEIVTDKDTGTTFHRPQVKQWFGDEIKNYRYIQQLPSMNVKLMHAYTIIVLDSFENAKLNRSLTNAPFPWCGNIIVMKNKGRDISDKSFELCQNIGSNELQLVQEYFNISGLQG